MRLSAIAISLAVLTAALTLRPTLNGADDQACENPSSTEVRALYETLEAALRAGDVEALTDLYSPDAILMGPGAASIRIGHGEIAAYYTAFIRHAPAARVIERVVRTECGAANDIGLEAVSFGASADQAGTPARFSLSYVRAGQRWLIVHHHQQMLEPMTGDATVADSAGTGIATVITADITTGTNPTPASPSASASAADANRRMQFVLPLPLPLPRTPEPPPIDVAALDRLLALVPPADIALPTPPFAVTAGPPRIDPLQAAVVVPKLGVTPALPAVAPQAAGERTQLGTEAEPTGLPALPLAPKMAAPVKPPPKPSVAGFAQRLPPQPAAPPLVAASPKASVLTVRGKPGSAKIAPAPPAAAAKEPPPRTGRFLRWDETLPIFDD